MKMLKILYRASSSKDYDEFEREFSNMNFEVDEEISKIEKLRRSQSPVTNQFLSDKSIGNCWAVTGEALYTNFLRILTYESSSFDEKNLQDVITSINDSNRAIIAMEYVKERKKQQYIILEVQKNEPYALLSIKLSDSIEIQTNKKRKLYDLLEVYSSHTLRQTSRYKELEKECEYSIEEITPETYPKTKSGKTYLDDVCLQSLAKDYGGCWFMMFDIIQKITKSSHSLIGILSQCYFSYNFLCDIVAAQTYIHLMIDEIIGFAALNESHVVAVLKIITDSENVTWKIVDIQQRDFSSNNLQEIFEELINRHLFQYEIVSYYTKIETSQRKRRRDEILSEEENILFEK
tara:strand:- start:2395 stop:3438 length:1044 start_codon:yes stop_codon:yes gene_type:complete